MAEEPKTQREILDGEILFFESLLDSLIDGDLESSIKAVEWAIDVLRRIRSEL